MKKEHKSILVLLFFIGIYIIFCSGSLYFTRQIQETYPGVSIRYKIPLEYQQVRDSRKYTEETEDPLQPTFWNETTGRISAAEELEPLSFNINTIYYDGDGFLIWPASFRYGGYPGMQDNHSCIISTELAWQLWGGLNVIDQICIIDGEKRLVQGVFEHSEPLALVSVNSAAGDEWCNVELSGTWNQDERTQAQDFAENSGLGSPDTIINGYLLQSFAHIVSMLPLILIFLALCFRLIICLKQFSPWKRGALMFSLCLVFSLLLPWFLTFVPAWSTPGKWSDFTYWNKLISQFHSYIQEWFMLSPCLKDGEAKWTFAKLFLSCIATIPAAAGIWRGCDQVLDAINFKHSTKK